MIDAKVATKNVFDYLHNLYEYKDFHAIELEEVELSEDEKYWFITVSYRFSPIPIATKYKIFKIRSDTGKVVSMKIRQINDSTVQTLEM